ncbi:transcription factor IIIB 50 kDa subunit isoform X1 [Electrophorus electricus]|uniref:Transcription factor IIIB 50 kDa subunit n=2 Tax=Electrophorus electricus TaxID=8005 RepID=A0A4W4FRC7_ELEEL|nr:transcription factor IIIB 50 kDa subunit isoform X1 [Electrophorus electricus]XP_026874037.2 transcription factor IIIB 50 kDa subunit isoform X1 [Electrophorus electricus]
MPSCPQCGSANVVDDDLYSQTQRVCADCGSIVSEGLFTTTLNDEKQSSAVPYYASTQVTKKPCPNLIKGLVRVRALCRILRLRSDMESGAVSLYERAYSHPSFIQVSLQKKEVLGGCCVLSTCRQHNWPVAMCTINSLLEAEPMLMGVVYQDLVKALDLQPPPTASLTDMLESYCYGYKLAPGEVPDVFAETPEQLVQRSAALVELAADVWLVTGRHPLPILMACVYVAWQSLKPKDRMKHSLQKFCQIARLPKDACGACKETPLRRVRELRDVLCKLGRELPWMRGGAVEPKTVATLVEDILKHQKSLLLKAMRSYEEEVEQEVREAAESRQDDVLSSTESLLAGQLSGRDQGPVTPAQDVPPARQPKSGESMLEASGGSNKTTEESAPPAGEEHWGRRHLFLPPCARNVKRRREESPGPHVTGEEEISDSEIESYIRSAEEIRSYVEFQKKMTEN